jgi:hypothetical protein
MASILLFFKICRIMSGLPYPSQGINLTEASYIPVCSVIDSSNDNILPLSGWLIAAANWIQLNLWQVWVTNYLLIVAIPEKCLKSSDKSNIVGLLSLGNT